MVVVKEFFIVYIFRCCEATMKVLRSHKDEILTVLEVMMFDPLYNW
jgi:phosphatidylinositol kinase/protein kinase (PI-3  family)